MAHSVNKSVPTMAGVQFSLDELVSRKEVAVAVQQAQQSGNRQLAFQIALQAVTALKDGRYPSPDAAKYLHNDVAKISKASPLLFFRSTDALVGMLRGEHPRHHQHSVQQANALLACSLLMNAYKSVDDWPTKLCLAYLDDLFGSRLWCMDEGASKFVANLETAFPAGAAAVAVSSAGSGGRLPGARSDASSVPAGPGGRAAPGERGGRDAAPGGAAPDDPPVQPRYGRAEKEQLRLSFFNRFSKMVQGGLQKESAAKLEPIFAVAARWPEGRKRLASMLDAYLGIQSTVRLGLSVINMLAGTVGGQHPDDGATIQAVTVLRAKPLSVAQHAKVLDLIVTRDPATLPMVMRALVNSIMTSKLPNKHGLALLGGLCVQARRALQQGAAAGSSGTADQPAGREIELVVARTLQDALANPDVKPKVRAFCRQLAASERGALDIGRLVLGLLLPWPALEQLEQRAKDAWVGDCMGIVCILQLLAAENAAQVQDPVARANELAAVRQLAAQVAFAAVQWVAQFVRVHIPSLSSPRLQSLLMRLLFVEPNFRFYFAVGEPFGQDQQAAISLLSWQTPVLEVTLNNILLLNLAPGSGSRLLGRECLTVVFSLLKRVAALHFQAAAPVRATSLTAFSGAEILDAVMRLAVLDLPPTQPTAGDPPLAATPADWWRAMLCCVLIAITSFDELGAHVLPAAQPPPMPTLVLLLQMLCAGTAALPTAAAAAPDVAALDAAVQADVAQRFAACRMEVPSVIAFDASIERLPIPQEVVDELSQLDRDFKIGPTLRYHPNCPLLPALLGRTTLADAWPWLRKLFMTDAAIVHLLPPSWFPDVLSKLLAKGVSMPPSVMAAAADVLGRLLSLRPGGEGPEAAAATRDASDWPVLLATLDLLAEKLSGDDRESQLSAQSALLLLPPFAAQAPAATAAAAAASETEGECTDVVWLRTFATYPSWPHAARVLVPCACALVTAASLPRELLRGLQVVWRLHEDAVAAATRDGGGPSDSERADVAAFLARQLEALVLRLLQQRPLACAFLLQERPKPAQPRPANAAAAAPGLLAVLRGKALQRPAAAAPADIGAPTDPADTSTDNTQHGPPPDDTRAGENASHRAADGGTADVIFLQVGLSIANRLPPQAPVADEPRTLTLTMLSILAMSSHNSPAALASGAPPAAPPLSAQLYEKLFAHVASEVAAEGGWTTSRHRFSDSVARLLGPDADPERACDDGSQVATGDPSTGSICDRLLLSCDPRVVGATAALLPLPALLQRLTRMAVSRQGLAVTLSYLDFVADQGRGLDEAVAKGAAATELRLAVEAAQQVVALPLALPGGKQDNTPSASNSPRAPLSAPAVASVAAPAAADDANHVSQAAPVPGASFLRWLRAQEGPPAVPSGSTKAADAATAGAVDVVGPEHLIDVPDGAKRKRPPPGDAGTRDEDQPPAARPCLDRQGSDRPSDPPLQLPPHPVAVPEASDPELDREAFLAQLLSRPTPQLPALCERLATACACSASTRPRGDRTATWVDTLPAAAHGADRATLEPTPQPSPLPAQGRVRGAAELRVVVDYAAGFEICVSALEALADPRRDVQPPPAESKADEFDERDVERRATAIVSLLVELVVFASGDDLAQWASRNPARPRDGRAPEKPNAAGLSGSIADAPAPCDLSAMRPLERVLTQLAWTSLAERGEAAEGHFTAERAAVVLAAALRCVGRQGGSVRIASGVAEALLHSTAPDVRALLARQQCVSDEPSAAVVSAANSGLNGSGPTEGGGELPPVGEDADASMATETGTGSFGGDEPAVAKHAHASDGGQVGRSASGGLRAFALQLLDLVEQLMARAGLMDARLSPPPSSLPVPPGSRACAGAFGPPGEPPCFPRPADARPLVLLALSAAEQPADAPVAAMLPLVVHLAALSPGHCDAVLDALLTPLPPVDASPSSLPENVDPDPCDIAAAYRRRASAAASARPDLRCPPSKAGCEGGGGVVGEAPSGARRMAGRLYLALPDEVLHCLLQRRQPQDALLVQCAAVEEGLSQPSSLARAIESCVQALASAPDAAACDAGFSQLMPLVLKHPAHVAGSMGALELCIRQAAEAIPDAGKEARRFVVMKLHTLVALVLALWPLLAGHVKACWNEDDAREALAGGGLAMPELPRAAGRGGAPPGVLAVWQHLLRALQALCDMTVTFKVQLHGHEDVQRLLTAVALLLRSACCVPRLREWLEANWLKADVVDTLVATHKQVPAFKALQRALQAGVADSAAVASSMLHPAVLACLQRPDPAPQQPALPPFLLSVEDAAQARRQREQLAAGTGRAVAGGSGGAPARASAPAHRPADVIAQALRACEADAAAGDGVHAPIAADGFGAQVSRHLVA